MSARCVGQISARRVLWLGWVGAQSEGANIDRTLVAVVRTSGAIRFWIGLAAAEAIARVRVVAVGNRGATARATFKRRRPCKSRQGWITYQTFVLRVSLAIGIADGIDDASINSNDVQRNIPGIGIEAGNANKIIGRVGRKESERRLQVDATVVITRDFRAPDRWTGIVDA